MLGRLDQMLYARLVGRAQRVAAPALEHGAFVDEDVVARLDGLLFGLFHGPARSGAQRFAVVQRNHLEHDGCRVGSIDACERLRATGARSAFDPDDRIQVALARPDDGFFERVGHARSSSLAQTDHDRERAAQFHEATTRDASRFEHALKL